MPLLPYAPQPDGPEEIRVSVTKTCPKCDSEWKWHSASGIRLVCPGQPWWPPAPRRTELKED